jgi:PAS domain S-box-containing protein
MERSFYENSDRRPSPSQPPDATPGASEIYLPTEPSQELDAAAALPVVEALAGLHESVVLIEPDGRVAWVSRRLAEQGGAGRLIGKPWTELLADASVGRRLFEDLAAAGRLNDVPVELLLADGKSVQARVSVARIGRDPRSAPVVAILRLGSEEWRREVEATLATARAFLDSSPDPVVVVDPSYFIAYANAAVEAVLGYRPEEVIDRPLALFVHGSEDLERIAAALRPENPIRNHDLEVRRRDGSAVCVSVSASLLRLGEGRVLGAVAYLRDVTERRRAEESLARKNAELEHYVRAVSHDLRSPLVSLLGFTRLLREDYGANLEPKGLHFLDRIEQAGRTMEALIRDLLELSRIGRTGHSGSRVNPRAVLLQLHAELKPRLDSQGVTLAIPDDPPSLACERTRLYQLFSNLIGNALDHMGEADPPRIEVEIGEHGEQHVISVRDHGRGIPAEHHERIFEVFHSLGPRRDGSRGTGMGLAIVRKIAETQGGHAWVESEPGCGACFRVQLPTG